MNILLVEDDENKRMHILDFISDLYPSSNLLTAASYRSGVRHLTSSKFDLVLLDMTMRTYDVSGEEEGWRPQAYGGRSILRQMIRRDISIPVIVITQFERFGDVIDSMTLEQLDNQLAQEFPEIYCGSVYYNPAVSGWRASLSNKLLAIRDRIGRKGENTNS
jgi:CheY-like chemotaxis protein